MFLYFQFFEFSIVTLPNGSYISQVSKKRPVFDYFCLFSQNTKTDLG